MQINRILNAPLPTRSTKIDLQPSPLGLTAKIRIPPMLLIQLFDLIACVNRFVGGSRPGPSRNLPSRSLARSLVLFLETSEDRYDSMGIPAGDRVVEKLLSASPG